MTLIEPVSSQDRQPDLARLGHAGAPERRDQLVEGDPFAPKTLFEDLAVLDQGRRLRLEDVTEALGPEGSFDEELSLPIIAFWTTFEMMSSTIRSNGVSWPTWRLPVNRKARSRICQE